MNMYIRTFVILVGVFLLLAVFYRMMKRQFVERHGVVWIIVSILTVLVGVFPNVINPIAKFLGFPYPPSVLYVVAIVILLLMEFASAKAIAAQEIVQQELSMQVSLLNQENECLLKEVAALKEQCLPPEDNDK